MAKTLGYFVTWTTYGTWLQGEEKGYVKGGKILPANPNLHKANIKSMANKKIILNNKQKEIVRETILNEIEKTGQKMLALAVCSNHIHIVLSYTGKPIEKTVGRLKNAARVALQKNGLEARVWSKGFDKKYCFDEKAFKNRVNYVQKHNHGQRTRETQTCLSGQRRVLS